MKIFFIIVLLIMFFFLLVSCSLLFFLNYRKLKNDVSIISKTIKKVRYGDINIRIQNLNNKELEFVVNRLLETIYDREMMIREYQATLSKKNLSLEEIIVQEKQLQSFKEEFAATLTHDMKVPVVAELNSIDYLLDGRLGNLNEKQVEILKLMKSSNQELKDLIENMLETYRLEQKGLKLNLIRNNFNNFIEIVIKEMYPIAYNTSHKIVYDIEKTIGIEFEFDELQLKRVIKNLIQNAISFSPSGSEIKISSILSNKNVKFIISNIGNNITKEDLSVIFNKYYSGHSKFRKAGTGLGLYLSQQIALAHKGNIDVNCSEYGITTFILTLPLSH